ncbi:Hypothetical protein A7982_09290 [Minicystis rosea]|nr:Hypothetical protein A7982_09290 [Minicystis rosea]
MIGHGAANDSTPDDHHTSMLRQHRIGHTAPRIALSHREATAPL